jgi:hypothetical protein
MDSPNIQTLAAAVRAMNTMGPATHLQTTLS